jgi:hypothetical protein
LPLADAEIFRRLVPRPARLALSRLLARRVSARVSKRLGALASASGPIVAGPWLGEVGFELLYWAPFLRWFVEEFGVEPSRLLVVSRGGTAEWYPPGVTYRDALDLVPAASYKAQHDDRVRELGEQKQTRPVAFERELVAALAGDAGGSGRWLHPSLMYDVLRPYWWGHMEPTWVHRHVRYRSFARPSRDLVPDLPASYVAVKFYANDCFPADDRNRQFVRDVVAALAAQGPVVPVSAGVHLDDHSGFDLDLPGVVRPIVQASPSLNLQRQSVIVANARAFVGTYGGFAYLAPFYGVPSTAYYSHESGFSRSHLVMARSAFDLLGVGRLLDARPAVPSA